MSFTPHTLPFGIRHRKGFNRLGDEFREHRYINRLYLIRPRETMTKKEIVVRSLVACRLSVVDIRAWKKDEKREVAADELQLLSVPY